MVSLARQRSCILTAEVVKRCYLDTSATETADFQGLVQRRWPSVEDGIVAYKPTLIVCDVRININSIHHSRRRYPCCFGQNSCKPILSPSDRSPALVPSGSVLPPIHPLNNTLSERLLT